MADIHVSSVLAGTPVSPFANWTNCAATIAAGIAAMVAGDRMFIDKAHTEAQASVTYTLPGTIASPNQVLCVTPDTVGGTGGTLAVATAVTVNATASITLLGTFYAYGINFTSTTNATQHISIGRANLTQQEYEECLFRFTVSSSTARHRWGGNTASDSAYLKLKNCKVRFSNTAQNIQINGRVIVEGLTHDGGSTPDSAFSPSVDDRGCWMTLTGYDFSDRGTGMNVVGGIAGQSFVTIIEINRCRPPASWSGAWTISGLRPGLRVVMTNSDNADTNYKYWERQYQGTMESETTIVRTGGASDGTTPFSIKMASGPNCSFPVAPMRFPCKPMWVTGGASKTVTLEIVNDGLTLNDDEIAVALDYLGNSAVPLASFIDDHRAILAAAAAQTSSSETWTTTGLASPVKQKLEVTFTPQGDGWVIPVVELYRPSTTVYLCPKPTVT